MGTTDSDGNNIRMFAHVKVVARNHELNGCTGSVIRVDGDRLLVAFPGGVVRRFRSTSIRVITQSPRFREQE